MKSAKNFAKIACIVFVIISCSFFFTNIATAQNNFFFAPWASPILSPVGPRLFGPQPFLPVIAAPPALPLPAASPVATAPAVASVSALTALLGLPGISTPSSVPSSSLSSSAASTVTIAWSGLWYSLLNISQLGPMDLVLTQNTTTGAVNGTVTFLLNKLVPLPTAVSGIAVGTSSFQLSGVFTDYQFVLSGLALVPINYNITLNLTLTSPTTISGTYSILSLKENDFGNVDLTAL